MSTERELAELVERVTAHYSRRCWWADPADIRAEAWLAALEARRNFNPEHGKPVASYARPALERGITRWLLRHSAPVSAPDKQRQELRGLVRASLDDVQHHEAGTTTAGDIPRGRWKVLVASRMSEIMSESHIRAALFVLVEPRAPASCRRRQPCAEELALASEAVEMIQRDEALKRLWEER